jgi:hypothetical protein
MIKKVFFAIVLILLLNSCEKKKLNFSERMLEKLNIENDKIPSRFSNVNLYIKCNEKEVLLVNNLDLFRLYNKQYLNSFKTFKLFLKAVLNDDFIVKSKLFEDYHFNKYKVKSNFADYYLVNGFDDFLIKYSNKSIIRKNEIELNKSLVKENEYLTIVYILYKNGYDISQDCISGKDYIRQRKKTFE